MNLERGGLSCLFDFWEWVTPAHIEPAGGFLAHLIGGLDRWIGSQPDRQSERIGSAKTGPGQPYLYLYRPVCFVMWQSSFEVHSFSMCTQWRAIWIGCRWRSNKLALGANYLLFKRSSIPATRLTSKDSSYKDQFCKLGPWYEYVCILWVILPLLRFRSRHVHFNTLTRLYLLGIYLPSLYISGRPFPGE